MKKQCQKELIDRQQPYNLGVYFRFRYFFNFMAFFWFAIQLMHFNFSKENYAVLIFNGLQNKITSHFKP